MNAVNSNTKRVRPQWRPHPQRRLFDTEEEKKGTVSGRRHVAVHLRMLLVRSACTTSRQAGRRRLTALIHPHLKTAPSAPNLQANNSPAAFVGTLLRRPLHHPHLGAHRQRRPVGTVEISKLPGPSQLIGFPSWKVTMILTPRPLLPMLQRPGFLRGQIADAHQGIDIPPGTVLQVAPPFNGCGVTYHKVATIRPVPGPRSQAHPPHTFEFIVNHS
jgi:hypothetical protein